MIEPKSLLSEQWDEWFDDELLDEDEWLGDDDEDEPDDCEIEDAADRIVRRWNGGSDGEWYRGLLDG